MEDKKFIFKIFTAGFDDLNENYSYLVKRYDIEFKDGDTSEGWIKFNPNSFTDFVEFLMDIDCPVIMTSTTIQIYDKHIE